MRENKKLGALASEKRLFLKASKPRTPQGPCGYAWSKPPLAAGHEPIGARWQAAKTITSAYGSVTGTISSKRSNSYRVLLTRPSCPQAAPRAKGIADQLQEPSGRDTSRT